MPLHCKDGRRAVRFQRLHRAVGRARRHAQPGADLAGRLVVQGVGHQMRAAGGPGEPARREHVDCVPDGAAEVPLDVRHQ